MVPIVSGISTTLQNAISTKTDTTIELIMLSTVVCIEVTLFKLMKRLSELQPNLLLELIL